MKKLLPTILFLIPLCSAYYSNKQANKCFLEQALPRCQPIIQQCKSNQACQIELLKYRSCEFGTPEDSIFNGFCFRKWREQSLHTKPMIECLVEQCDLLYNSITDVKGLFMCAQEVLISKFMDCNEACMADLNQIRQNFEDKTIQQLFQLQFTDPAASQIVEAIRNKCIAPNKSKTEHPSQQQSQSEQCKEQKCQDGKKIQELEL